MRFLLSQGALPRAHLCIAVSTLIYICFLVEKFEQAILCFVLLGLIGSLARTDFIGIAVALLVAAYFTKLYLNDNRVIKSSWGVIGGALLGFILIGLHNYLIADDWLSTSARMKQHWGTATPINPFAPLFQFLRSFLYIAPLTGEERVELRQQLLSAALYASPVFLIVAGTIVCLLRNRLILLLNDAYRRLENQPKIFCLFLTAIFTICGYLAIYSINTMGMQSWYSAHVFVPMVFLLMLFVHIVAATSTRWFLIIFTACSVIVVTNLLIFFTTSATYYHQTWMRDIGLAVADGVMQGKLPTHVGISDAGIAGYYSDGHIVNLDGLVNLDIAKYFPNHLPCYFYESNLSLAGGFGTSEMLSPKIDWNSFSDAFSYRSQTGESVGLRKLNLEKINAIYHCDEFVTAMKNSTPEEG